MRGRTYGVPAAKSRSLFNGTIALVATLGLFLCASCNKLAGAAVPEDVLATCLATSNGRDTVPKDEDIVPSEHSVRDFLAMFEGRGKIVWEPDSGRSGIIRMHRVDKLNGKANTLAFELIERPALADHPACASGISVVSRFEGDGTVLVGYEAQVVLMGMMKLLPKSTAQEEAAQPMLIPPADDAPPPIATASDRLIDGCYHLDSCSYYRTVTAVTELEQGAEQLVRVTLEPGSASEHSGTPGYEQRIMWGGSPITVYVFCSTRSPIVAWQQESSYLAQELDFGGSIPGVQQNDANIYQAVCHDIYDNSLANNAAAHGYAPLPNGGRGQFELADLKQLF